MVDFLKLAQPGITELSPYQPGKPIEELERELGIVDIILLKDKSLINVDESRIRLFFRHVEIRN